MLFRLSIIMIIMAALSFTTGRPVTVSTPVSDSAWHRFRVPCFSELKRKPFDKDGAPVVPLADYARIDSAGLIKEVILVNDTLVLSIVKHTFWGTNPATNSIERKILGIDSFIEKTRWECEYVGPGKGNCDTCQATDCNGVLVGLRRTGLPNRHK